MKCYCRNCPHAEVKVHRALPDPWNGGSEWRRVRCGKTGQIVPGGLSNGWCHDEKGSALYEY